MTTLMLALALQDLSWLTCEKDARQRATPEDKVRWNLEADRFETGEP